MRIPVMLLITLVAACGPAASDDPPQATELSRRQKDSLVAQMPVRGAGAVGKALDALEASERRAEAHDTIS